MVNAIVPVAGPRQLVRDWRCPGTTISCLAGSAWTHRPKRRAVGRSGRNDPIDFDPFGKALELMWAKTFED
jgi:hypothetical protein